MPCIIRLKTIFVCAKFEDIKELQPEDTLQLVLEAETEEQRSFYEMVGEQVTNKSSENVAIWAFETKI